MDGTNLFSVSLRNLEEDMSHAKGSGNARISLTNGRERNKKAQESGHTVRDIFCRDIKPIRTLLSTEELEGPTIHQDLQECAREGGTSITEKFSGGSLL